ncbi:MAG TPA: nuclear transport factor 2 family protein [Gemmatimonadaceae bacterium]|nr:nuclear transport factor 2 family protein [Gemmatimonadaceae bacterium]
MTSVLLPLVAVLAAAPVTASAQSPATTVILVRHGEKANEPGADPALSSAGETRARALAAALRGVKVSAVLTTPFRRTNLTAAPFAKAAGVTPEVVPVSGGLAAYGTTVAELIRNHYAGRTVLVVGHSNTIPAVIAALGGPKVNDLCENEYSTMYTLTLNGRTPPKLIASHYGAPDPADAGCRAMTMPMTGPPAPSAADSAAVRRAVLDYVEGFYEGDSTKFVRSVRPDVFKYGFWRPRDSTTYQGEQMKFAEFNAYANRVKASGRKAPPTARKEVTLLDVQDRTASAKLTAVWGTDYLLLGKFGDQWMVSSVLWQSGSR